MKNEILDEVWHNRDEFARKYNYGIDAMVTALQEMEKKPLSRIIDRRGHGSKKTPKHNQKQDNP
jgi:hypothetical protein